MLTVSSPSDRYSVLASPSSSPHHPKSNSFSPSSTFFPLHATTSSFHLSQLSPSADYRSMLSLKSPPIARVSPRILHPPSISTLIKGPSTELKAKDEHWLSCDELESIEKRFADLLQGTQERQQNEYQPNEYRTKSCDRLALDERDYQKNAISTLTVRPPMDPRRARSPTKHRTVTRNDLSANEILKVEASYRSIGTQVFVARSLCDLYITTAERLAKLEDWIYFQHGLPVWLLNSGTNPQRPPRLSLLIAEHGSGFPLWEDTINRLSEVKQARAQHVTFRLSDQVTLGVLRFHDLSASREFFSSYLSIRNDHRNQQIFAKKSSNAHHRSSSVGSILARHRKSKTGSLNKSSISNPCQFQHITSLQARDRLHLTSLEQCLLTSRRNFSDEV